MEIKPFKDLVEAVGAAGDAVAKITDGIKHLMAAGVDGYDAVSARIVYRKLVKASAQYQELVAKQIETVGRWKYADIVDTLCDRNMGDEWKIVPAGASRLLDQVSDLLTEFRRDRSDFVLEPAYAKIRELLGARVPLLEQLASMDPPSSPEEVQMVRDIAERYDVLVEELRRARDEMNAYIKTLKP